MKLIGYVRVYEGESLADQYNPIHRYCNLFDHELVDVVADEYVSPLTQLGQRPGGGALLKCLYAGQAEGVVLERVERAFSLNGEGLCQAIDLKRGGYAIHAVRDYINTATPAGWLAFIMQTVAGEYAAPEDETGTDPLPVLPTNTGRPGLSVPYGCIRIARSLYRDPETWPTREKIVHMRRVERRDFEEIIDYLHTGSVPAPGGGTLWHAVTIQGLLRNHDALGNLPLLQRHDNP